MSSIIGTGVIFPSLISVIATGMLAVGLIRSEPEPTLTAMTDMEPEPSYSNPSAQQVKSDRQQSKRQQELPLESSADRPQTIDEVQQTRRSQPRYEQQNAREPRYEQQNARKSSYDNVPPFQPVKTSVT